MKANKSVVIAMVLGGLALSGAAVAKGYGHGPGGFGHGLHGLLRDVELTDEQTEMLEAVRPAKDDREAVRAEREADRTILVAELEKGTPDAERLHALLDTHLAERAERMHEALDAGLALYATLTPEQRAQVLENLDEMPQRGERGERGERGPGKHRPEMGQRPDFER